MKKIMFNDKFGLTEKVLLGQKTTTRRFAKKIYFANENDELCWSGQFKKPAFEVGEEVAIAQCYGKIYAEQILDWASHSYNLFREDCAEEFKKRYEKESGWNNKMFVKPQLMPHKIRITGIRRERLQDITDEECLAEGVEHYGDPFSEGRVEDFSFTGSKNHYSTPREAFAKLIDKVSGKGTWKLNPYVYVYTFEKI